MGRVFVEGSRYYPEFSLEISGLESGAEIDLAERVSPIITRHFAKLISRFFIRREDNPKKSQVIITVAGMDSKHFKQIQDDLSKTARLLSGAMPDQEIVVRLAA